MSDQEKTSRDSAQEGGIEFHSNYGNEPFTAKLSGKGSFRLTVDKFQ